MDASHLPCVLRCPRAMKHPRISLSLAICCIAATAAVSPTRAYACDETVSLAANGTRISAQWVV